MDVLNDSLDKAQVQLDETFHGEECCSQLHFVRAVSGELLRDEQHMSEEGESSHYGVRHTLSCSDGRFRKVRQEHSRQAGIRRSSQKRLLTGRF